MYLPTFLILVSLQSIVSFQCLPGHLAVYTLKLKTYWDERQFPKQYPQWRPAAQWSKTLGYVHNGDPELFRVGSSVSEGVKEFIQTGDSQILEQEIGNKSSTILDSILLPQVLKGVGESQATVFVDGNHTKVSVITKLVPSPDWFVGLDSIELCKDGQFIENLAIKVDPLDGGTDNGFTFTSPNWPTEPQGGVFRISHNYPTHPAGSFHYPHLTQLPTLAQFFINKKRDYQLAVDSGVKDIGKEQVKGFISNQKDTNQSEKPSHQTRNDKSYEYSVAGSSGSTSDSAKTAEIIDFVPLQSAAADNGRGGDDFSVKTNEISVAPVSTAATEAAMTKAEKVHPVVVSAIASMGSSGGVSLRNGVSVGLNKKHSKGFRGGIGGYHASSAPEDFFKKKYKSEYLSKAEDVVFHRKMDKTTRKNVLESILNSYRQHKSKDGIQGILHKRKRFRRRKHKKNREPKSCRVSAWADWSSCSKSCGIGEAARTRTVIKHPRHGGTPCPKLKEFKWCGSARNCNSGYFHW